MMVRGQFHFTRCPAAPLAEAPFHYCCPESCISSFIPDHTCAPAITENTRVRTIPGFRFRAPRTVGIDGEVRAANLGADSRPRRHQPVPLTFSTSTPVRSESKFTGPRTNRRFSSHHCLERCILWTG